MKENLLVWSNPVKHTRTYLCQRVSPLVYRVVERSHESIRRRKAFRRRDWL